MCVIIPHIGIDTFILHTRAKDTLEHTLSSTMLRIFLFIVQHPKRMQQQFSKTSIGNRNLLWIRVLCPSYIRPRTNVSILNGRNQLLRLLHFHNKRISVKYLSRGQQYNKNNDKHNGCRFSTVLCLHSDAHNDKELQLKECSSMYKNDVSERKILETIKKHVVTVNALASATTLANRRKYEIAFYLS